LASGSIDSTIKLWDITSGLEIRTFSNPTGFKFSFCSVDLLNSQTLVSGLFDGTIKLWNWTTGECLSTIQTNADIFSLAVIYLNIQQQNQTTTMSSTSISSTTTTLTPCKFSLN
jgi:WD40 repeat protein